MRSTNRWHSFTCALQGLIYVVRTQPNSWIELTAAVVVTIAGILLRVTPQEWAILALTVFTILALEAMNSALEAAVDLASPEYHELARIAKDCAAGALLFAIIGSLAVAAAIFGPRLLVRL